MTKILDLKGTLNLPKTTFPMKASLPQTEPRQLEEWEQQGIYRRILRAREGRPEYVLHDGPPYPTGEIHLGTGLNKILKDMVVKSKSMAGFRAPYVPGWDCHGLPIETKVEKELPGGKGSVPPAEFRRRCREFALQYVDIHRREFKRLGIFGRWERPYLTMDPHYEATIAGAFVTFLEKGYVYRGLKPVYWCLQDSTALAEAEVEYEDHTSPSIWVKFAAAGGTPPEGFGARVDALIWTTTPWTLPANRALCFHPELDYVVLETPKGNLLIAAGLRDAVEKALGVRATGTRGPWKGGEFEGVRFQHPFLEIQVPGVLGGHVTLEQGSGIVHTAPGHGAEDFYTGQKYGLDIYAPQDDEGRFVEGLEDYKGKTVFEANPHIVKLLERRGALLASGTLTHSYPHCWRCHQPVIFRATEQWFIELDRPGKEGALRPRALDEIARVAWTPEWGGERLGDMVAKRPDWCVSRQRMWGVPLVIFDCEACGKRLEDIAALRYVVEAFETEGADAWFSRTAEELLPRGTRCECGAAEWRKENDILDVWFDSGSSHLAVLDFAEKGKPGAEPEHGDEDSAGQWPADMYLEGPDQYRGWFHSSLLVSLGVRGQAPYGQVLSHGWTLDEQGRPMSKSLGNAVYPKEVCEKWGADLLRVWVASQDYHADVTMSDNVMKQLAEAYRKLRNTFRYILGNLHEFEPERDALPDAEMEEFDRWMLEKTSELAAQCRVWYENFEFHRVFHALHEFATVSLSAFYFDVLKDRLYTLPRRSRARRSAQTAIWRIGSALVRLAAPVMVFTAEEVWKHLPRRGDEPESVHLAEFPTEAELNTGLDASKDANWELLVRVRNAALQAMEPLRQAKTIAGSLEAKVTLQAEDELGNLLDAYAEILPALFIVSQVERGDAGDNGFQSEELPDLRIGVQRAEGAKCERCWNYSTAVGAKAEYPTVCGRCVAALEEIEREAQPAS